MEKQLGNRRKGLLFVLSAPAGTGKTTLVTQLVEEYPCVMRSVSYTTREPREGEIDGVDYHFVTEEQFQQMIKDGKFLEFAKIYENHYGTSQAWVNEQLESGKHVVLVIDTQGAKKLRGKMPAVYVFVKPPSFEELRRRLELRSTETENLIEERLEWASNELKTSADYDYCLVNDDLHTAYRILESILIAEEHKVSNILS